MIRHKHKPPSVSLKDYNANINAAHDGWRDALKLARDIQKERNDALDSSDRQASRIEAMDRRIECALACVTPGANATVRKMAAILRGYA